jgi:PPOX class probable F420-dependent enzyme
VEPAEARRRFAAARLARLATAGADGHPHVVPVTFAVDGDTIYTAVDHKPKRTRALKRLANIAENPQVALLADHYDEDWSRLWWARADGSARVREEPTVRAAELLRERYEQYRSRPPEGPLIAVSVDRWSGWTAG